MSNYFKGILFFILSLLVSALNDVAGKYLSSNLPFVEVVFLRFLIGAMVLIPIILFYEGLSGFKTSRIKLHMTRGLVLFVAISIWYYGLTVVPMVSATLITFTIPVFVLILAGFFLHERITFSLVIVTAVCFIGSILALGVSEVDFDYSALILLMSALMFALLDIINKKYISKESIYVMLFYSALFTAVFSAPPSISTWVLPSAHDSAILFLLGVGGNAILYFILKAFQYVPASSVAPYRYLELIFSGMLGVAIFNEIPSMSIILGSLIIIPATLYITFAKR